MNRTGTSTAFLQTAPSGSSTPSPNPAPATHATLNTAAQAAAVHSPAQNGSPAPEGEGSQSITMLLANYEQKLIDDAMNGANGVKRQAAVKLGISRYALERRIRRLRALREKSGS